MQATTPEYRAYQEQVLSNSSKFAQVPSQKEILLFFLILDLNPQSGY